MLLLGAIETNDMLRLLADLAGVDDYETPAEQLAEALAADMPPDPAARRAEVMAFLLATGGGG